MNTQIRTALSTFALTLTLLASVFGGAACDSDDGVAGTDTVQGHDDTAGDSGDTGDTGEHDPLLELAERACAHFETGPFNELDAGGAADETAPEIEPSHNLQVLTLVAQDDAFTGHLRLHVHEAGEFFVALSDDTPLAIVGADGAPIEPEETPDVREGCAAIVAARIFDFAAGEYTVTFGPADRQGVDLLVVGIEDGHGHEDGEHEDGAHGEDDDA